MGQTRYRNTNKQTTTMTKEEILTILEEVLPALLKPTTDKLLGDVTEFMNGVVTPLADKIEAVSAAPKAEPQDDINTDTTETSTEDPTMSNDPLMARVKLLEQQLADAAAKQEAQEKAARDMRFNSTLSAELDKLSPIHKNVVQELLANRLKGADEVEGKWLYNGQTLEESIKGFFGTPEGMHFLPSKHVNGAGVDEPQTPKTGDKLDLDAALAAAFL